MMAEHSVPTEDRREESPPICRECDDVGCPACNPELLIYRCGWCGFPTDAKGAQLHDVGTPAEADEYLAAHHGATVRLVNGFCCPGGDEEREPDRMQVTRDMAIDAGDPNLEGAWITW